MENKEWETRFKRKISKNKPVGITRGLPKHGRKRVSEPSISLKKRLGCALQIHDDQMDRAASNHLPPKSKLLAQDS